MEYKVIDLKEKDIWNKYYNLVSKNQKDIYFSQEYYSLYNGYEGGKAKCFIFENENGFALYPFLQYSVNELGYILDEEYFDIQGIYGYNGVISNNLSKEFADAFSIALSEFCKKNNIIAEFLRLNPLIDNLANLRTDIKKVFSGDNVYIDLSREVNDIFEIEYDRSTRKNIRKAEVNDLEFCYCKGDGISDFELNAFCDIYDSTMQRNNAEEFYYFGKDFFKSSAIKLKENALFVFVKKDNIIISCELILLGDQVSYSYLGGTLSDYYSLRPNDFLKHKAILLLKELGYKYFLLGGGPEGVLRYKKTFSKNGVIPFYFAKMIHNAKIFDEVIRQWENKNPELIDIYKNYFLKYRIK